MGIPHKQQTPQTLHNMRAITRLFLACLAVTSLVAVACAQPYTLNPSGATVDWHVATEWDFLRTLKFGCCYGDAFSLRRWFFGCLWVPGAGAAAGGGWKAHYGCDSCHLDDTVRLPM